MIGARTPADANEITSGQLLWDVYHETSPRRIMLRPGAAQTPAYYTAHLHRHGARAVVVQCAVSERPRPMFNFAS